MSTRKQSPFFSLIILLTRLCVIAHAKTKGPRGLRRRVQTEESQIVILAEGRPGLLTEDHLPTLSRVFQETYNASPECIGVQEVVIDGVEYFGTGFDSESFTITGRVSGPLFNSDQTITLRRLPGKSKLHGKAKSKYKGTPLPPPKYVPPTMTPLLESSFVPAYPPPTNAPVLNTLLGGEFDPNSAPVPSPTYPPPTTPLMPTPTLNPSVGPTMSTTASPTAIPTNAPPTNTPLLSTTYPPPTSPPVAAPTLSPSAGPTLSSTASPTAIPTNAPPTNTPLLSTSEASLPSPTYPPPTSPPVPAPTWSPSTGPTLSSMASPTTIPTNAMTTNIPLLSTTEAPLPNTTNAPTNAPIPRTTNAPPTYAPSMSPASPIPTNGPPTTDDMTTINGCWTQSAFVSLYDEAVRNLDLAGSIDEVLNVYVDEYVNCEEYNEFQTDVLVSFTGDPSLSTASQLEALEASFIQTYSELNSLNPDTCDPFFREAVSVDLITNGPGRELSHRSLATGFNYVYRVSARCRGCETNGRLFGEGSGRRLLGLGPRQLQEESCVCPVDATEFRAPTEDEFQSEYANAIEVLKSENIIDGNFIESLEDIQEEEAKCGDEVTFEMTVLLELSGTHYNVTAEEMVLLTNGVIESYKAAASTLCDPHSRFVESVSISTHVESGDPAATFDHIYNTTIRAACQGCNSNLFSVEGEELETSCFCGPDLTVNRAPTSQEFEIAFNDTLKNLNLQNLQHLVDILE